MTQRESNECRSNQFSFILKHFIFKPEIHHSIKNISSVQSITGKVIPIGKNIHGRIVINDEKSFGSLVSLIRPPGTISTGSFYIARPVAVFVHILQTFHGIFADQIVRYHLNFSINFVCINDFDLCHQAVSR
ncbi:hypothetical protein LOAG_07236 [Loa loa]|uniref:Uncharacterized protein n=1 Tax=Loa loa TaxID=7209 RepID=A0A1S0TWC0_LOALO|nr:hypothetical protein LOAG_07236 [Loa loa]EFO21252.1 hypothetical protein LOAG_07236 [Loa loa]